MVKTTSLRGNGYTLSVNPAPKASNTDPYSEERCTWSKQHLYGETDTLCQVTQHQRLMLTHTVKTRSLQSNRYTLSVNPASKACNANSHGQNNIITEQQIHCQLTQYQRLVMQTHMVKTTSLRENRYTLSVNPASKASNIDPSVANKQKQRRKKREKRERE